MHARTSGAIRHRRKTFYKEAGLHREGWGRRAGVGVVVTWKQVMIRSQAHSGPGRSEGSSRAELTREARLPLPLVDAAEAPVPPRAQRLPLFRLFASVLQDASLIS